MRQLTSGLAVAVLAVLAVTGCAATTSTSGGKAPAAGTSRHGTTAAGASSTATATARPGGLSGINPGGPAQWVVRGTFASHGTAVVPLSGVVTFRDSSTGHTVNVTVGTSGTFSLGLTVGTYTVTGHPERSTSRCPAPVTVTVQAGDHNRVSLVCSAS